jgi:hypothetical protein
MTDLNVPLGSARIDTVTKTHNFRYITGPAGINFKDQRIAKMSQDGHFSFTDSNGHSFRMKNYKFNNVSESDTVDTATVVSNSTSLSNNVIAGSFSSTNSGRYGNTIVYRTTDNWATSNNWVIPAQSNTNIHPFFSAIVVNDDVIAAPWHDGYIKFYVWDGNDYLWSGFDSIWTPSRS